MNKGTFLGWYVRKVDMPVHIRDFVSRCGDKGEIYNRRRYVGFGMTLTPAIWPSEDSK